MPKHSSAPGIINCNFRCGTYLDANGPDDTDLIVHWCSDVIREAVVFRVAVVIP